ncbi:MAG: DUF4375 domain-containing protein [Clostridia bacterium]|nr:DUF4375 domain-containing protein [Clostridia bacterium]
MGKKHKQNIDDFIKSITEIKKKYRKENNIEKLAKDLLILTKEYHNYMGIGDYLLTLGEEYISNNDYWAGITFIKIVDEYYDYVANTTLLNLRMAEYHIENNEIEIGIKYLLKLCSAVSNYEESIEFNELTAVWEKYKHLVKDKVPASVAINSFNAPLKPEECSLMIDEIFSLPKSEIIDELSTHINELSANGSELNYLNKTEKVFYYIDELCSEVNSGGFESYLYYNGNHFQNAVDSLETIKAVKMLLLMKTIQSKFPKNKIPKSLNSIQNIMDSLEEKGIDFEIEDSQFYDTEEKALLTLLLDFVFENKSHFR